MKVIKGIWGWLTGALLTASVFMNVRQCALQREEARNRDTTRVTVMDTVTYYLPVPKEEKPAGSVVGHFPVVGKMVGHHTENSMIPGNAGVDSNSAAEERAGDDSRDAFAEKPDSAYVEIPITRKTYEDSTYRAVISGYGVSLDEMQVFPRRETVTIRSGARQKRWSVGIQVGYGITPAGFQPYAGVGVTYNLFGF